VIATITLTDTADGITAHLVLKGNGMQDHREDSLACMVAAQFSNTLAHNRACGTIKVTSCDDTPLPRVLRL